MSASATNFNQVQAAEQPNTSQARAALLKEQQRAILEEQQEMLDKAKKLEDYLRQRQPIRQERSKTIDAAVAQTLEQHKNQLQQMQNELEQLRKHQEELSTEKKLAIQVIEEKDQIIGVLQQDFEVTRLAAAQAQIVALQVQKALQEKILGLEQEIKQGTQKQVTLQAEFARETQQQLSAMETKVEETLKAKNNEITSLSDQLVQVQTEKQQLSEQLAVAQRPSEKKTPRWKYVLAMGLVVTGFIAFGLGVTCALLGMLLTKAAVIALTTGGGVATLGGIFAMPANKGAQERPVSNPESQLNNPSQSLPATKKIVESLKKIPQPQPQAAVVPDLPTLATTSNLASKPAEPASKSRSEMRQLPPQMAVSKSPAKTGKTAKNPASMHYHATPTKPPLVSRANHTPTCTPQKRRT